jgi:hypothetical protein
MMQASWFCCSTSNNSDDGAIKLRLQPRERKRCRITVGDIEAFNNCDGDFALQTCALVAGT